MRISVVEEDPGYHPMAWICVPYLNGKEIKRCFTADEEKGEVHCYEENENGYVFADKDNPGCLKTIVLYGDVKIVTPKDFYLYNG